MTQMVGICLNTSGWEIIKRKLNKKRISKNRLINVNFLKYIFSNCFFNKNLMNLQL